MPHIPTADPPLTAEEELERWVTLVALLYDVFRSVKGPEYGKDLFGQELYNKQ